jgi:hypothetical protein
VPTPARRSRSRASSSPTSPRTIGSPVGALALVPPDRFLVGSNLALDRWKLAETGMLTGGYRTHSGTDSPQIVDDGSLVAWLDLTRGAVVLVGDDGPQLVDLPGEPDALAITADRRELVVSGRDGTLAVWPLAVGELRVIAKLDERARDLHLSPSQRWIVSGQRRQAVVAWPFAGGAGRELAGTSGATSATVPAPRFDDGGVPTPVRLTTATLDPEMRPRSPP